MWFYIHELLVLYILWIDDWLIHTYDISTKASLKAPANFKKKVKNLITKGREKKKNDLWFRDWKLTSKDIPGAFTAENVYLKVDSGEINRNRFGKDRLEIHETASLFLSSERLLESAAVQHLWELFFNRSCRVRFCHCIQFDCEVALRPRFCTRGVLPYISHIVMYLPKGGGFASFWSENGHRFCSLWSGIGYGFQGNYGSVRT